MDSRLLRALIVLGLAFWVALPAFAGVTVGQVHPGEDVFSYMRRTHHGEFSQSLYRQIVGAANAFKEGDEKIGVAAEDEQSRARAQLLIANTTIHELHEHPLLADDLNAAVSGSLDRGRYGRIANWTVGQLKEFLLSQDSSAIKDIMPGLDSEVIADVVKLMSNDQIISVSQKIFNPLPGSHIGAKGYLSARVQPNSPTDNPEDVRWQVFSNFSYGVGDLMLGNNPVSSEPEKVAGVELALRDILHTFKVDEKPLADAMPWSVLSHIKIQDQVEKAHRGSTALLFQSIAGNDATNKVFGISLPEMIQYAKGRKGRYGLYLETGQGSEFSNQQSGGVDMLSLEARKYGLARALQHELPKAADGTRPWLMVNDVAGFIGPEVFRNGKQLLRVVLEDTLMGKLHGLTMGLDVCSVYHGDVNYTFDHAKGEKLSDPGLEDVLVEAAKANPAYVMSLSTPNDPMLSYLSTSPQQHVYLRHLYGYKINEPMQKFFEEIGVVKPDGSPGEHFGDPVWVYYKYRRMKGDARPEKDIYAEGRRQMNAVIARDVPIAYGHGKNPWDLDPKVEAEFRKVYEKSKLSPWKTMTREFAESLPHSILVRTNSDDRKAYIYDPQTGESLDVSSRAALDELRQKQLRSPVDAQIVISDGLNATAISDRGHLKPLLDQLRTELAQAGLRVSPENIVVENGRVRVGYQIGEQLFGGGEPGIKTIIHVIGERPGTKHDNYSVYIASADEAVWSQPGAMDHERVKVVAGISDTALKPRIAAHEVAQYVQDVSQTASSRCFLKELEKERAR